MTSVTANTMVQKALVGLVREVVTAQSKQYGFDVAEAMGRLEVKMASGRKTASEKVKEATIREQKATIRSLQKELKAANSGHTKALQQVEKLRKKVSMAAKSVLSEMVSGHSATGRSAALYPCCDLAATGVEGFDPGAAVG